LTTGTPFKEIKPLRHFYIDGNLRRTEVALSDLVLQVRILHHLYVRGNYGARITQLLHQLGWKPTSTRRRRVKGILDKLERAGVVKSVKSSAKIWQIRERRVSDVRAFLCAAKVLTDNARRLYSKKN